MLRKKLILFALSSFLLMSLSLIANFAPALCDSVALGRDCSNVSTVYAAVEDSGEVRTGSSTKLDTLLNNTINVLSAVVGLVVVGNIIFAGIQYQTARDNASQVSAAKERIGVAVVSLLLFFFAYAILQWLVPGGIF